MIACSPRTVQASTAPEMSRGVKLAAGLLSREDSVTAGQSRWFQAPSAPLRSRLPHLSRRRLPLDPSCWSRVRDIGRLSLFSVPKRREPPLPFRPPGYPCSGQLGSPVPFPGTAHPSSNSVPHGRSHQPLSAL